MSGRVVRAALIDLDGTLLDTIPDLASAANRMLVELRLKPLPATRVRDFVGKGIAHLVQRCLVESLDGQVPDAALTSRAEAVFGNAYEDESGRCTALFPGVVAGLEDMQRQGLRLACVTNKIARFTMPLLNRTGLAGRFAAVVCGDHVSKLKPDAEPYTLACEKLGLPAHDAVVIGDSENDMIAGRAAGCRVLCVPYGYTEGADASSISCDARVETLMEAAHHVRRLNQKEAVR